MENKIKEMGLQETLEKLKEQKSIFLNEILGIREKMSVKIDELIQRTENLQQETDLENKVMIGSFVDLRVCYGDNAVEYVSYYLGFDFSEDTVSIFSPLGYSIYGANVNQTITYSVKGNPIEVTIINKNVVEEKLPEDINLSNPVAEGPVKKKINN